MRALSSRSLNGREFSLGILNVNDLKTEKEVLQWYIDMNAGGTPHSSEEIQRVREMIEKLG